MKRKILTTIICLSIVATSETTMINVVKAEDVNNIVEITENSNISDIDNKIISDAEALIISDNIDNQDINDVEEVLDNGTGIIAENNSIEDVEEYFDVENITEYEHEMGCYIVKDGEEINIVPLEAVILSDENSDEKISETDYEKLLDNEELNYEEVVDGYYELNSEDKLTNNKLEDDELASLQGGLSVSSSFAKASKMFYIFGKSNGIFSDPKSKYSENKAVDQYIRCGSIKMTIYANKAGTKKGTNTTFDNVSSIVIATGEGENAVKSFKTGISFNSYKNCEIVDYTDPDYDTDKTVSIGTGVDGEGNITTTVDHTYNPNKLEVSTTYFDNRVRWTCKTQNQEGDRSWKIKPSVLLEKTDGKKKSVKMTVYVSSFVLRWGTSYTKEVKQNDTISCSIKFKNHKEVN